MERDFKKNRGVLRERVQVKYAYIASQRTDYPIEFMCRVLEESTSGFFFLAGPRTCSTERRGCSAA